MTQHSDAPTPRHEEPYVEEVLRCGEMTVLGQIASSSNATFLVEATYADAQHLAVHKPEAGEHPLWDFEPGLYRREVAAYLVSEALGWHIVPTTVMREDGPLGVGSLQLFIDHDPAEHYFTLFGQRPETHDELRRLALFDLVINNADRKAGHVLYAQDQRLWGIDHGLCFAAPDKLRTVIWDFAGELIDEQLLADVAPMADQVPDRITELLNEEEITALQERVEELLLSQQFLHDPTGMRFPWPLV